MLQPTHLQVSSEPKPTLELNYKLQVWVESQFQVPSSSPATNLVNIHFWLEAAAQL